MQKLSGGGTSTFTLTSFPGHFIPKIIARGQTVNQDLVYLKWLKASPAPGVAQPQFAALVPTRVSKKAVLRNRLRRRLRASVNSYCNLSDLKKYMFIIIARPKAAQAEFAQLEKQVHNCLSCL